MNTREYGRQISLIILIGLIIGLIILTNNINGMLMPEDETVLM